MHVKTSTSISVVVVVMTEWGEFVLLSEAVHGGGFKLTFPLAAGKKKQRLEQRAADSIDACLGICSDYRRVARLEVDPSGLYPSGEEREVGNRQSSPAICSYILSWREYRNLLAGGRELHGKGNAEHLSQLAARSGIRFVSRNSLMREVVADPQHFHDTTLSILKDPGYHSSIMSFWSAQLAAYRSHVVNRILAGFQERAPNRLDDTLVIDIVAPRPDEPAAGFEVEGVFADGKATTHGAYTIGEMRNVVTNLGPWETKLAEPFHKYVRQELEILERVLISGDSSPEPRRINAEEAVEFVREVLHFPLEDGTCLRNHLTNLEEITACRHALRAFLKSKTDLPQSAIENPIGLFNEECNRIVAEMWPELWEGSSDDKGAELEKTAKLCMLLNALDFHSPEFNGAWGDEERIREIVEGCFMQVDQADFSSALGGGAFFREFLARIGRGGDGPEVLCAYLTDNNGQLVASLKFIEALMSVNQRLKVILVPKNGSHWNDASWADVDTLMDADASAAAPIFKQLREYLDKGRFEVCREGPQTHGLHPAYMSKELCYFLRRADLVVAEGQAYAEIRGWLKPTYLMFQISGRVAEAIHGVPRSKSELAFVRVGLGIDHYGQPRRLPVRVVKRGRGGHEVHVFGQTTADYVKAVLSDNYVTLKSRFYGGDEVLLSSTLRGEVGRTGRNVAEIILGSHQCTSPTAIPCRNLENIDVFAIGGGGGFNQVTLRALKELGVRVAAGVPSTDDGGSSGKLQDWLSGSYGYMFGMGDAASILEEEVGDWAKMAILSFRPNVNAESLTDVLLDHISDEAASPTFPSHNLTASRDWFAFVCRQLDLARTIDRVFLGKDAPGSFPVRGSSVRNLNILSAFHQSGALSDENHDRKGKHLSSEGMAERAEQAWSLLEDCLGLDSTARDYQAVLPVSYERAVLWARYSDAVPGAEIDRLSISDADVLEDATLVYRQKNIDKIVHEGKIVEFGVFDRVGDRHPKANPYYLAALNASRLVLMGAGALYSSQLAQLAIPEVMAAFIKKRDTRKVLIVNHVLMNETNGYSLTDHIQAIERVANRIVPAELRAELGRDIRIADVFTDIVVPRTVAREIDCALRKSEITGRQSDEGHFESMRRKSKDKPVFVGAGGASVGRESGIYLNRYVAYVLDHPDFREKHRITDWELRILGYLEQDPLLTESRSEAGRYRGAVYAMPEDIDYIVSRGIPRRNIYEVECIAMNTKVLKAEGKPRLETFPGLIPEALVGVLKILLEKGMS